VGIFFLRLAFSANAYARFSLPLARRGIPAAEELEQALVAVLDMAGA